MLNFSQFIHLKKNTMKKSIEPKSSQKKVAIETKILKEHRKWTCAACDGNSQTGCLSTTGECYR
ncbi:MAG: hypothetical protein EAZ85_02830 [Bacteroidetes bacterium]|nr:MAG: hypothetical protein EAZ85_02830 [Bacteroidota bacterium]TAG92381.1 MAG: hypothetical protein EAZ20_02565 [Bacteroidota bacterium]